MKEISPTSMPSIKLKNEGGIAETQYRAQTNKIGWVRTVANKPGASFDFVVSDALGREMFRRPGCTTETEQFAQLMNIDTHLGEDLTVSLENIRGADDIELYLN
jgi:hypothetical protein